jgi:isoquinoline 1-oxidoreductase beta subunit
MDRDRREFLRHGGLAVSGLVVASFVPEPPSPGIARAAGPFAPNAFVRISPDDAVTIVVNKSEMGQGVHTALSMLVAEELDCDWSRILVESAPVAPEYDDPRSGEQITHGSTSVLTSWGPLRTAGAVARALLVEAAARTWGVGAGSLRTEGGRVHHDATGRSASYGELAATAATLPVPAGVRLKRPRDFRVIGTSRGRLEGADKVTGAAQFGIDVRLPGMLTAVVARAPVCGGRVRSFRAEKALAVRGVVKVKEVPTGLAVIAKDFWSARTGRDALEIAWDEGRNALLSTEALRRQYRELAETPGIVVENAGDCDKAIASSARTLEAVYEVPYLAHAPMEPLNAVAHVRADGCDVWTGTQYQTMDQKVAAAVAGLRPEHVRIHTTLLGGGFGRRASLRSDFVAEAVAVAKGEVSPVRTVWTREDDIRGGYYRPMFVHRLRAGLDGEGLPIAWHQRLVGQSIAQGTVLEPVTMKDGVDLSSVMGAHLPYAIDNRRLESRNAPSTLSVLWWRSVGHSHTGFVNESFLDELAHAGGRDPLELRLRLLEGQARHLAVLQLAAEKAGWGTPPPEGRARGIAVREAFGTFVAEVAEVSLDARGEVRVHRVVCAVDCGIAVNPRNVAAQIESGVVYGLSAALYGELTVEKGRVRQSNFHDYPVLRMDRVPAIEVHVVRSEALPTGAGEPGLPPVAPAVGNALFALTGKRVRKLPIRMSEATPIVDPPPTPRGSSGSHPSRSTDPGRRPR